MHKFRLIMIMMCIFSVVALGVTTNITVQFLVADIDNGVFDGNMTIHYELYPTKNIDGIQPLWREEHIGQNVTQGQVIKTLGQQKMMNYHDFKSDDLHLRIVFLESRDGLDESDDIVLPMISVPAAIVSKYSEYAREIEYTAPWFKINTVDYKVGIGVTQNLTDRLHVVGSANITTVNAVGAIHSPDGFNIHKLDYEKIVNLDDYSLSPYDYSRFYNEEGQLINAKPTVDVVYVTTSRNVGIGFLSATSNIKEKLHVTGNVKVDSGVLLGNRSSIYLEGELPGGNLEGISNQASQSWTFEPSEIERFMWDSHKASIRAGQFSGQDFYTKVGQFSAGFGYDNQAISDYSFAVGKSNIIAINAISSTITGGESNEVYKPYSGILSGQDNKIENDGAGFSVISGGYANDIRSNYGFIGSGQNNTIEANSNFSSINGGDGNTIVGHKSSILGGEENLIYGDFAIAMGLYAHVGKNENDKHDKVFIFSDGSTGSQGVKSTVAQQFLVHAENGLLVGVHDGMDGFQYGNRIELTGQETYKLPGLDKHYPPLASEWQGDNSQTGETYGAEGQASEITQDEHVKKHTIWTAGDIVAIAPNDSGTLDPPRLGYIVGDGRFLTNISSLWSSNSEEKTVYVTDKRIGIGAMNNGEYDAQNGVYSDDEHSLLYIKEVTDAGGGAAFPAVIRWESDAFDTVLDMGVTDEGPDYAFINTTKVGSKDAKPLLLNYDSNEVMRLTDTCVDTNVWPVSIPGSNPPKRQFLRDWSRPVGCSDDPKGELFVSTNVGIQVADPIFPLDVAGNIYNTGEILNIQGIETSGNVTANRFIGNGFYLTELQVSYMSPTANLIKTKQVMINNNGELGIGSIAPNMMAYSGNRSAQQGPLADYMTASNEPADEDGNLNNKPQHLLYIGDDEDTPQLWLGRTIGSSTYTFEGSLNEPPYTKIHSKEKFDIEFNNYTAVDSKVFSISSRGAEDFSYSRGGSQGAKELVSITAAGDVIISGFAGDDPNEWGEKDTYITNQLVSVNVYGMVGAKAFHGDGSQINGEQLDVPQDNHVTFNHQVTMKEALTLEKTTTDYCSLESHVGSLYHVESNGISILCFCESSGNPRNTSYYTPQSQNTYSDVKNEVSLKDYEVVITYDDGTVHDFYVSNDNRETTNKLILQSVNNSDQLNLTISANDEDLTLEDEDGKDLASGMSNFLFKNPLYNSNYCRVSSP